MWLAAWSVSALAADVDVRPIVVRDSVALLALGARPAPLPRTPSIDGAGWTEAIPDDTVDGVHTGDAWAVLGDDGSRATCRVIGFRQAAADAEGYGSEEDPTCGGWAAYAELSCDAPAADGVAVAGRRTRGRSYAERTATPEQRSVAERALAESAAWKAVLASAPPALPVSVRADVRAFGPWLVVEASAYTGEGWSWCGAEDFVERRVLVIDAVGRTVLPPRDLADAWGIESRIVDGVYDLEMDGVPELHVVRPLEEKALIAPDGAERASLATPFCGCPC